MTATATTQARRVPARDLLTASELTALRERTEWKGIALAVHAWSVILGSMALVAVFPNPLTYIFAVMAGSGRVNSASLFSCTTVRTAVSLAALSATWS